MHVIDGTKKKAVNGSRNPATARMLEALQVSNMSNGSPDVQTPESAVSSIPIEYVTFAKWLLSNPQVVEIMLISSDLPTIATLETDAELDSGSWFLCRVDLESLGESIVSFVKRV